MTLRLVLVRHAKSDWDDPRLDDHDRPLNPRGLRDAPCIGAWIALRATPDTALVSTALRARETWAGLAATLPHPPEATFTRKLYHAGCTALFEVLHGARGDTVLLVGHNPGIAEFAAQLLQARPAHPAFGRYPTCATAVIDLDTARWEDLRPGSGQLTDFIVPKDLPRD